MASIETVLSACYNCAGVFELRDGTNPYALTNEHGWETPNAAISDVTSSILTVTDPNGVIVASIDVSASLPSVLENDFYNYIPTDGDTQTFIDGIWYFDWVVKGTFDGDDFYVKSSTSLFVKCSVKCCVQKLEAKLDGGCGCKGGDHKAVDAMLTYKGMCASYDAGNHERAKYLLTQLQEICANNCKGC